MAVWDRGNLPAGKFHRFHCLIYTYFFLYLFLTKEESRAKKYYPLVEGG